MADIEKVIKGLDFCTSTTGCTGCPYEDPCHDIEQRILGEAIMRDALELLKEQRWIPVSEKLPEEHDTIFAKLKGTDKWNNAMCEKMSDDVTVVCVFEDGERVVSRSRTVDGKWHIERYPIKRTVTHWMPNPALPKGSDGK